MGSACGLILLLALLIPLVVYVSARLAGYGWSKGQWQFLQDLYKRDTRNGDEERP